VLRDRVAATGKPVIYANLVGGQDELVFDGASFAIDGQGRLTHQLPAFVEALEFVDLRRRSAAARPRRRAARAEAEVYAALKLGVPITSARTVFPAPSSAFPAASIPR
jgi:NAD+ synthase (glutamine-hydrolysing)